MALYIILSDDRDKEIAPLLGLKYTHYVYDMHFQQILQSTRYNLLFTDFAKRVISEIDDAKPLAPGSDIILKNDGRTFLARQLSQGTRTLLTMSFDPECLYRGFMGDNCTPFLEELSLTKDIYICLFIVGILSVSKFSLRLM